MDPSFTLVFALFPGLTHLDFTAPHQILCRLPHARVLIASEAGGDVQAEAGMVFARTTPLAEIERCDLICVPGGFGVAQAVLSEPFIRHLKRLAASARYVTSVCNGSLILGAAGLLVGKRAACHWHWRHLLPEFGAIADPARVVRDGNLITGGGVTAGIDFALTVAAELAGSDYAEALQLGFEYAPEPPFNSGRPDLARPEILATVRQRMAGALERATADIKLAAARMC